MVEYAPSPSAASAMDYREHERTYRGFIRFVKLSTAAIIVILVGMAIFLL